MDKFGKIKRLIESSLDTSFGGEISIREIQIVPTQKFDETCQKWIPDSHAIFLTLKKTDDPKLSEETYGFGGIYIDASKRITDFLEGFLGFEVCVEFS